MTTLVILAGGLGSRYKGNKQLAALGPNNECLLEYSIYDAVRAGFQQIVVLSSTHFISLLKAKLAYLMDHVDLIFINQFEHDPAYPNHREIPLGTGHAIWSCRNVVKDDFMVVNADDYYGSDAFKMGFEFFKNRTRGEYGLISYTLDKTLTKNGGVSRGVCELQNSMLIEIKEHTEIRFINSEIYSKESEGNLNPLLQVSMNCWLLNADLFSPLDDFFALFYQNHYLEEQKECQLPGFIQLLLAQGVVFKAIKSQENWFGLTHIDDFHWCKTEINRKIKSGLLPAQINFLS